MLRATHIITSHHLPAARGSRVVRQKLREWVRVPPSSVLRSTGLKGLFTPLVRVLEGHGPVLEHNQHEGYRLAQEQVEGTVQETRL